MKLNRFDGGLNKRVDPSLILLNEGIVYKNIDNSSLLLKSVKDLSMTTINVQGYFYNYKGSWLSSTDERSYTEYRNFLYFTEKDKEPQKYNTSRQVKLGITGPSVKVTATQAEPTASEKISASNINLQYSYTYYNSQDDIESAPSPISDDLALAADKVVDISDIIASTDVQVDKIRLYRIGDSITTMTLVMEVTNSASVLRDDIPTVDLPGSLLDTYDNLPPPTGLMHLTEAYGIMFGVVNDKIVYSKIGKPDYWPAANEIDFSRDITGILPVPNGLLVFSTYTTDILVGTSSSDFSVLPISSEQGSISHLSGKLVRNQPIWVSTDGICAYSSGIVEVISKDKLGKENLSIVNTVVYDEVYYICLTDGTLRAIDARYGLIYKDIEFTQNIGNLLVYNDVLYARVGDFVATLFTGANLDFEYTSAVLTEQDYTVTKLYNNIYIRSNATFTIKVYIDTVLVLTKVLTGDTIHDISSPAAQQRGSSIQFNIVGNGIIYALEYKVSGRQNGR